MNKDLFRNKLVDFCKSSGLGVSSDKISDKQVVFLNLNLMYYIFFFDKDKDYFEVKTNQELFPSSMKKCYDWTEESLLKCMDIARYWIKFNKHKQLKQKLKDIEKDF